MFIFLVYLFVAVLGLHHWEQANSLSLFSNSDKLGLLSSGMGVLLIVVASLVAEHGL